MPFLHCSGFGICRSLAVSLHYSFLSPPVSVLHPVPPCVHALHCSLPSVPLFVPDHVSSVYTVKTEKLVGFLADLVMAVLNGKSLLIALIGNLLTNSIKHHSFNLRESCSGFLYPCEQVVHLCMVQPDVCLTIFVDDWR